MTAYGSDTVYRFEAELAKVPDAQRDPWISYGIPPTLSPEFQRSGRGTMFKKPHRVEKTARVHFPVHKADGVEFPTLRLTEAKRKQLRGTSPTRRLVSELHRQGRTSADIADELGVSVRTVERHLARAA